MASPAAVCEESGIVRAAVAEALHVDCDYERAAGEWRGLAAAGFRPAEAALKASISFFAAGEERAGRAWLRRAAEAGAPEAEVLYVQAQLDWGRGQLAAAEAALERAAASDPSGRALTALGVIRWREGRREEGHRCFRDALARDPGHAPARINLASAALQERGDPRDAAAQLREASRLEPHRPEPFVLFGRLLRQGAGEDARVREAFARARLRRHAPAATPPAAEPEPPAAGLAVARISREGAELRLHVRLTVPAAEPRPHGFRLNPGYHRVEVAGIAARECTDGDARQPAAPRVYEIPAKAWRANGGGWSAEIAARGRPRPPCVRLDAEWIELGEESAWLPGPLPAGPWRWALELDLGDGFEPLLSTTEPGESGVGLIALRAPIRVGGGEPGAVPVLGHTEERHLRRAADLVGQAGELWERETGAAPEEAPVVVLDRPTSLFCYHRRGYTRLSSGIFIHPGQDALVYHEAGHRLWGGTVRFAADAHWLCEALAEYTMHLAEEAGSLPGYARATLDTLLATGNGRLPEAGLAELGRAPGHGAAYALRAKGGWVIRMLREVAGEGPFRATLRAAVEHGRRSPLDGYTFFALASYLNGASLSWFARQWVDTPCRMSFSIDDAHRRRAGRGYELSFRTACRGIAVPGAPVGFLVRGEGGQERRVDASLELGEAEVTLRTPFAPRSITIDPFHRWFAEVPQRRVMLT